MRFSGMNGLSSPVLIMFPLIICLGILAMVPARSAWGGEMSRTDPMIRITSMPTNLNIHDVLVKVSKDVSQGANLDIRMITYYWQTFDAVYCPGCEEAGIKNGVTFVDMYVPAFMTEKEVQKVMTSLAAALHKHAGIDPNSIYMYTHVGEKGRLYIKGRVLTDWSLVGGPKE